MAILINGLGGTSGFGENVLPANDDGSSAAIDITSVFESGINFFGTTYTSLFVNNNGNISFGSETGDFNPNGLSDTSGVPIIAAFWSDVDTRAGALTPSAGGNSTGSNLVYWDLDPAGNTFTATWDDVGEFSNGTVPNAFQLQLTDLGGGDFSIRYIYEAIDWTDGAGAGYSARDGVNFFEFPASRNDTALPDLVTSSNIGDEGVFEFGVADGIPSSLAPLIVTNSAVNVLENTTLVVDIQATDNTNSEGNGLTYSLSGGEDQSLFTVNAATGVLSFLSAPDFENPLDVGNDNGYGVEVTVTDAGGLSTAQLFNITVTDVVDESVVSVPVAPFRPDLSGGTVGRTVRGDNTQNLLRGSINNDTLFGVGGDDTLYGLQGNDVIVGNNGNDLAVGGFSNDQINGGAGSDTLRGDGGNDFLLGGNGNDLLLGGVGSDLLVGGQGADTLVGGGGQDYFRYSSFSDGNDVIRDFAVAEDVIDLVPLLNRTQFSGNTALQKFNEFVTLTQVGANTQVSINSAGSGAPPTNVLLATLEGVTASTLTASNFAILGNSALV